MRARRSMRLTSVAILLASCCCFCSASRADDRSAGSSIPEPLPGLVPAPRRLPGVGRWQLIHKLPRGRIYSVAWSPDGNKLAFSEGSYIRICDAKTFETQRVLVGHSSRVTSIDWNRKTNRLASASFDGTVRFWSADGVPEKVLRGHTREVLAVSWTTDGRLLASASKDQTLRIWNVDGALLRTINASDAGVNCVAWSPDASRLFSGDDNCQLKIWTVDGRLQHVCGGQLGRVTAVAMSPDGKRIGSATVGFKEKGGSDFADVRLWNTEGGLAGSFLSSGRLFGLRWTSDGKSMVVVSHEGRLQFLGRDAEIRGDQNVPIGGRVAEAPLACSPDGTEIAVGGTSAIAIVTIGESGTRRVLHENRGTVNFRHARIMALDRQRDRFIVRFPEPDDGTQLVDLAKCTRIRVPFEVDAACLSGQSISPKGDRVAFVIGGNQLSSWDAARRKTDPIAKFDRTIVAVAWNPVDERIACLDDRGTVRVMTIGGAKLLEWRPKSAPGVLANNRPEAPSPTAPDPSPLQWVAKGRALAVAEETRLEVQRFDGTAPVVFEIGRPYRDFWISPDLERAATWINDDKNPVLKLAFADRSPTKTITDFSGEVHSFACNQDVTRFIVGGGEGEWEMRQLDNLTAAPQDAMAHPNETVSAIAFAPDGLRFATGGWDGLVHIWRADGELERTFAENTLPISRLWWSGDGKRLVSVASSGTFLRWSIEDGHVENLLTLTETARPMLISRDGEISPADAKLAADEFFALIEKPNGSMEISSYTEFLKRSDRNRH